MKTQDCHCCQGTGKEIDSSAMGVEMRSMRELAGLTLKKLARRIKLSEPYLSELERGNRRWTEELMTKYRKGCA